MEWWVDESTDSVQLGDEPLEILQTALRELKISYERELGRPPTLKELTRSLELVLHTDADKYLENCAQVEVKNISIRTAARKKKQAFQIGDFFSFPVTDYSSEPKVRYGFGRVLDIGPMGTLVAILDKVSDFLILPKALVGQKLLFPPVLAHDDGLIRWRWRVLSGHIGFSREDYPIERFRLGEAESGWRIMSGKNERRATWEEVKDLEPARMWSVQDLEDRCAAASELISLETIRDLLQKGKELFEQRQIDQAVSALVRAYNYGQWGADEKRHALSSEADKWLTQAYHAQAIRDRR